MNATSNSNSSGELLSAPPPNAALVQTLQDALSDAISQRVEGSRGHLLRAVKPLIMDSISRTDDAVRDLQDSMSSQLHVHANKLSYNAAQTEHLGQCMESGIQVSVISYHCSALFCTAGFHFITHWSVQFYSVFCRIYLRVFKM